MATVTVRLPDEKHGGRRRQGIPRALWPGQVKHQEQQERGHRRGQSSKRQCSRPFAGEGCHQEDRDDDGDQAAGHQPAESARDPGPAVGGSGHEEADVGAAKQCSEASHRGDEDQAEDDRPDASCSGAWGRWRIHSESRPVRRAIPWRLIQSVTVDDVSPMTTLEPSPDGQTCVKRRSHGRLMRTV